MEHRSSILHPLNLKPEGKSFARRRQATLQHRSNQALRLEKLELFGKTEVVKLSVQESTILTAMARSPAGKLETWQIAERSSGFW